MGVCSGITRSGGRCTVSVSGPQEFCHLHDPARADERKRAAARGGKARANRELSGLKAQLQDLTTDVLAGDLETGRAAVANQLINTRLRAIELERKIREADEFERRLEALENSASGARGPGGVGRGGRWGA